MNSGTRNCPISKKIKFFLRSKSCRTRGRSNPLAKTTCGFSAPSQKPASALPKSTCTTNNNPNTRSRKVEKAGEKIDYRVTKMKLSKDKTSLIYNQFLTLSGIPPETYEYRLGNRSALEWVIDQYQVSTDKRSGITNDPNREDDREYILRLIGQVITVSLETVKIVRSLPNLGLPE
ncbi:exported hypothetical protein [Candidatus Sulfotelmatobacter kueseliae]|uniref:Type ISP restriction-modification enzyme LLaBIII C-terminal specificity domain-containing protein n=1 Tax=Candidatus Sulfotelmatobacter kueseliae TaxID=2042962 RepID=A0A2U3KGZ2_9BACT|nr:exported hypothetical protein [Candidatus Sulfotelmatobacter kueseliae]